MLDEKRTLTDKILKCFHEITLSNPWYYSSLDGYSSIILKCFHEITSSNPWYGYSSIPHHIQVGYLSQPEEFSIVKFFSKSHEVIPSIKYKNLIIYLIQYKGLPQESDNNDIIKDSNSNNNKYADIFQYLNTNWVSKYPHEYKDILLYTVRQDGMALQDILQHINHSWVSKYPDHYKDILLAAVQDNGMALKYITKDDLPGNLKTKYTSIVLEAVKKNPLALQFIDWLSINSKDYFTIIKNAVERDRFALEFVDIDFLATYHKNWDKEWDKITKIVVKIEDNMIKSKGREYLYKNNACEFIDLENTIREVVKIEDNIIKQDVSDMVDIKDSNSNNNKNTSGEYPDNYKDILLCNVKKALKQDGIPLQDILQDINHSWVLNYTNDYYKDILLCTVKQDGMALKYITKDGLPDKLKTIYVNC